MPNENAEIEQLGEAIAATERELFKGAFDDEDVVHDETGDQSLEQVTDEFTDDEAGEADESGEKSATSDEGKADDEPADDGKAVPERDPETGKFVAKDKDAEKDKDAAAQAGKSEPDKVDQSKAKDGDGKDAGRVPSGRLREQTERADRLATENTALKTQIDAIGGNAQKAIDALNARLEGVLATLKPLQPAPAKAEPEPKIDLFENPEGFVASLNDKWQNEVNNLSTSFNQQLAQIRIESSLQSAAARHSEAFPKAYDAMQKLDPRNPDDLRLGQSIMASPNPGEAMVQWWKRNETLRAVGDDPAAYAERIRTEAREALAKDPEFRKQLLADLRADAGQGDDGKARTVTRLPRSLNGASGGRSAHQDDAAVLEDTDQAHFARAWTT